MPSSITDSKEAPPSYFSNPSSSADSAPIPSDPPPAYHVPHTYKIGSKILAAQDAMVNVKELKAHLTLLRAFKTLQTEVQTRTAAELNLPLIVENFDKKRRWSWFVGLAVER